MRDFVSAVVVVVVVVLATTSMASAAYEPGLSRTQPTTPSLDNPGNETESGSGLSTSDLDNRTRSAGAIDVGTGSDTVVIELYPNGTDEIETLSTYGVTVEARAGPHVQGTVPAATRSAVESLPWVRTVRPIRPAHSTTLSEGVSAVGADQVKAAGVTGENVTVGVIDVGFNVSNPEIADNVVEHRSFTGDITNGGADQHGTAVSEIIVDAAPNASLYVANVNTMVEFANAVDWLERQGVDVISVSLAWYAAPFDGTSLVSQAATEAVGNGTVVAIAAGNAANGHWQGPFENGDGDAWANFTSTSEVNYLNDGDPLQVGATVDVYLTWNDWASPSADYNLYMYRVNDSKAGDDLVAWSERDQSLGLNPYERISGTVLTAGEYYVAVANISANGTETLELFAVDGDFSINNASSSITAPAVAKNVTGVGAFHYSTGELESFSSHGPTNDGRRGVDLTGPDGVTTTAYGIEGFFGTSAGTPHVSGIATLVLAKNPDLSPLEVDRVLTRTAADMQAVGPDERSGYGRLNASIAVDRSVPAINTTGFVVTPTSTSVGQPVTVEAALRNDGLVDGATTVNLIVDGTTVASQSAAVSYNQSSNVTFGHAFDAVGNYSVSVADRPPVVVSVPSHVVFDDQRVPNGSANVTVALTNATREYYVQIRDGNGTAIGRSSAFPAGAEQADLQMNLSRNLTTTQQLTATVRVNGTDEALGNDTAQVTVGPVTPVDRYDTDGDGIQVTELLDAISDFRSGQLDVQDLLDIIDAYRSG